MFCLSDRLSVDDLANIQNKLYAVTAEWYNLGLQLGLRASTLDRIEAKYNSDPSRCFCQVLKEWLKGVNPLPTWQAVVNALKSPTVGQYEVAEQIETELPKAQPMQPPSPQLQSPQLPSTSAQPHPKSIGLLFNF